jgi:hypothetical protein
MAFNFRLPDLKGNDSEQLKQLKSYLYQLIPQLEWAFNTLQAEIEKLSVEKDQINKNQ